jgi:hypothetical protein
MTDWASLGDAYGSAVHLPELLARAAQSGPGDAVWDELWSRLCHQGTVYSASYAAFPVLAEMSLREEGAAGLEAMHLAAAIIASSNGPEEADVVRQRYRKELAGLREVAERNLSRSGDDIDFVYGLQAVMAFEDGGVWERNLDRLVDGEVSGECPSCGEDLYLQGPDLRANRAGDAAIARTDLVPGEPDATTIEGRILELARAHQRSEVATRLPYLFGHATCPHCRATIEIRQLLN